jgi:hypothetical protein
MKKVSLLSTTSTTKTTTRTTDAATPTPLPPSTVYTSTSYSPTKIKKMMMNNGAMRPSTAGSNISTGTTSSQVMNTMKMERDLLERMVQERDEKNKALQRTIDLQKEYIGGLQSKNDKEQERQKQQHARQKLYLQSITHEKNLIKSQLAVLQKENKRIKEDPLHKALTQTVPAKGGSPLEGTSTRNATSTGIKKNRSGPSSPNGDVEKDQNGDNDGDIDININDLDDDLDSLSSDEDNKLPSTDIRIFDGDQRCLILQSQLYQAMSSLSTLQQQTVALKENYDEIVNGLQKELIESEEAQTKMEVKLLSRMTVLEREKSIVEELLQQKIKARDARLKRLEKRIQNLDSINDDESLDGDDEVGDGVGATYFQNEEDKPKDDDSIVGVNGNDDDHGEHSDDDHDDDHDDDENSLVTKNVSNKNKNDNNMTHEGIDGLLSELEMLSAHSSSRKLFSNSND